MLFHMMNIDSVGPEHKDNVLVPAIIDSEKSRSNNISLCIRPDFLVPAVLTAPSEIAHYEIKYCRYAKKNRWHCNQGNCALPLQAQPLQVN